MVSRSAFAIAPAARQLLGLPADGLPERRLHTWLCTDADAPDPDPEGLIRPGVRELLLLKADGRPLIAVVRLDGQLPALDQDQINTQIQRYLQVQIAPMSGGVLLSLSDETDLHEDRNRLRHLAASFADVANPRSFHARMPTLRLDRIYVRGFNVQSLTVHHGPPWARLSDHAALSARLVAE